jgi:hypothetical protein
LVMFRRNSFIVAAASAAAQSGPAAAVVCDAMVRALAGFEGREGMSEREMFAARAEAAVRAQRRAGRRGWALPRVGWRGVVGGISFRRPRLAA